MVKGHTSVYLDQELIKQAKNLGINLSQAAEKAIMAMVASAPFRDEEVYLDYLIDRKAKLVERVRMLKHGYEDADKRLKIVGKRLKLQEDIVEELHLSTRIAHIIGQLNEILRSYAFDYDVIKEHTAGVMEQLNKLKPGYFDDRWLKMQIERIEMYG